MEQFGDEGASKELAENKASNFLLAGYRKKLRSLYLSYVRWFHALKSDPAQKNVMPTVRRFLDDDDMDFEEAAEAAVDKRKFFIE